MYVDTKSILFCMRLRILGVLGVIALLASCASKPEGSSPQSDAGEASGSAAVSSESPIAQGFKHASFEDE